MRERLLTPPEAIENADLVAAFEQALSEDAADVAGAAGEQDALVRIRGFGGEAIRAAVVTRQLNSRPVAHRLDVVGHRRAKVADATQTVPERPSAATGRPDRHPRSLMRIAHLTATFPPYWGGTGTVAFNQAAGLAARGHDVHVFTGTAGGTDDPAGVTVHRMKPVLSIGNAPLLPQLARLDGFDVVHFHHPFIFGTEAVLAGHLRRNSPALVATYHNRLIGERGRAPIFWLYEETMVRTVMRAADRVCVVSMDHAESIGHLRAGLRRHPERYVEVPNGVDTDAFRPGPVDTARRVAHGVPADATVGLFAAALDRAHHFKRLDLVIEAEARTADLHLLVIGGGEL